MRSAFFDAYSAYRFVLGRPVLLIRFGLWPLIAAIVMVILLGPLTGVVLGLLTSIPGVPGFAASIAALFLIGLPWCWFTAILAVRWHRLVLLGEDRTTGLKDAFSPRVGYFFACVLVFQAICTAGLAAGFAPLVNFIVDAVSLFQADRGVAAIVWPALVTTAYVAVLSGVYAVLLSQIGLVFPSIAADRSDPWKRLWRLSNGRRARNLLSLFFVSLAPAVLWSAIAWVVEDAFGPDGDMQAAPVSSASNAAPPSPSLAEGLTTYAFSMVIFVVMISATAVALSHMYRSGVERQAG